MIFAGKLIRLPYWLCWQFLRLTGRLHGTVFYLEWLHDYYIIEHILPHIRGPYRIAARNRSLAGKLKAIGVDAMVWPVFPGTLVMARHALHRFPIKGVRKIGLMHGPYYFKKMVSAKRYNAFDLYLFTSESVLEQARQHGVACGKVGGYPRLDAFRDPKVLRMRETLSAGLSDAKKTVLFTATWDQSGQSAVHKWAGHVEALKEKYNVIISLHPMMSAGISGQLRQIEGIRMASQQELYACMLLADILVSDTSSVIAEFCALDKPVITFSVGRARRLTPKIQAMIQEISLQIDGVEELDKAIARYRDEPSLRRENRRRWNRLMYGEIKIPHGLLAASGINAFIASKNGSIGQ
jgi:CDP-glycerol glycerophosphotransferase (TagB/SpsB family)